MFVSKNLLLISMFAFILIFSPKSFSQQSDPYLAFAEQMPQPVGGIESIYKLIQYPNAAKEARVEGKVYLLLYINENGKVDDIKVLKGIGFGCDQAASDAVKKVSFMPGKNNGKAIKVKLSLAVTFKLI